MTDDDPPLKQWVVAILFITLVLYILFVDEAPPRYQRMDNIMQENTLLPLNTMTDGLIAFHGYWIEDKLFEIIKCESNLREEVCNKAGCTHGQGLAQIIPKTEKTCEKHFQKEMDMFDPKDNLRCAIWLYNEQGTTPWGCEDCDWGSWLCWNNK